MPTPILWQAVADEVILIDPASSVVVEEDETVIIAPESTAEIS